MDNDKIIAAALIEWCGIDLERVIGPAIVHDDKNLEEVVKCMVWTLKQDPRARQAFMNQFYNKDEG